MFATSTVMKHPLGVAFNENDKTVLAVDSYNHKVKEIDIESKECISVVGTGESGNRNGPCLYAQFNEPGGISYSNHLKQAFVADSNNHSIKIVDFENDNVRDLCINWSSVNGNFSKLLSNKQLLKDLELSLRDDLNINFKVLHKDGYYLTEGSPSQVELQTSNNFPFLCLSSRKQHVKSFGDMINFTLRPDKENENFGKFSLTLIVTIYVCKEGEGICMVKRKTLMQPVIVHEIDTLGGNAINIEYLVE